MEFIIDIFSLIWYPDTKILTLSFMSSILKISNAASLALHTMVLLAEDPDSIYTVDAIATELQASRTHLQKVLQRLVKSGFIKSTRGPKGGFRIGRLPQNILLIEIYEAFEGKYKDRSCLLDPEKCNFEKCIFKGLAKSINQQISDYLTKSRLSDLVLEKDKK